MENSSHKYLTSSHGKSTLGKRFSWLGNIRYFSCKKKKKLIHNLSLFLTENVEYFCGIKRKKEKEKEKRKKREKYN